MVLQHVLRVGRMAMLMGRRRGCQQVAGRSLIHGRVGARPVVSVELLQLLRLLSERNGDAGLHGRFRCSMLSSGSKGPQVRRKRRLRRRSLLRYSGCTLPLPVSLGRLDRSADRRWNGRVRGAHRSRQFLGSGGVYELLEHELLVVHHRRSNLLAGRVLVSRRRRLRLPRQQMRVKSSRCTHRATLLFQIIPGRRVGLLARRLGGGHVGRVLLLLLRKVMIGCCGVMMGFVWRVRRLPVGSDGRLRDCCSPARCRRLRDGQTDGSGRHGWSERLLSG